MIKHPQTRAERREYEAKKKARKVRGREKEIEREPDIGLTDFQS